MKGNNVNGMDKYCRIWHEKQLIQMQWNKRKVIKARFMRVMHEIIACHGILIKIKIIIPQNNNNKVYYMNGSECDLKKKAIWFK